MPFAFTPFATDQFCKAAIDDSVTLSGTQITLIWGAGDVNSELSACAEHGTHKGVRMTDGETYTLTLRGNNYGP